MLDRHTITTPYMKSNLFDFIWALNIEYPVKLSPNISESNPEERLILH